MMRFLKDERGATAIEYAVLTMIIGVAIIAALISIADSVGGTFGDVSTGLTS